VLIKKEKRKIEIEIQRICNIMCRVECFFGETLRSVNANNPLLFLSFLVIIIFS